MTEQSQQETFVEIEYFTADRFGEKLGVSLHDALAFHPQARIMRYAGGAAFMGEDAKVELKETKAEIRDERAEARAAAKAEADAAAKSDKQEPVAVVTVAPKPDKD